MKKETKHIKDITSIEELKKVLEESERALLDLRIDNRLRKLKNVKSIYFKKKEIALIKTKKFKVVKVLNKEEKVKTK